MSERQERFNRIRRAAKNEAKSWTDALEIADFTETHNLTREEADEAISMLQDVLAHL